MSVSALYDRLALDYDRERSRSLMEKPYLLQVLELMPDRRSVLDVGCGGGEPIARFFIEAGCQVTGVDAAFGMIQLCESRFPDERWVHGDMRNLELGEYFDAIVAWDSFFHLTRDDQRAMFLRFANHLAPGGVLLFTSGATDEERLGTLCGHALFHASLATAEYRDRLDAAGFVVRSHTIEDPACGLHTVWVATLGSGPALLRGDRLVAL